MISIKDYTLLLTVRDFLESSQDLEYFDFIISSSKTDQCLSYNINIFKDTEYYETLIFLKFLS